jgi:DNA-binding transcriptional regulator YhcF (GntR family)
MSMVPNSDNGYIKLYRKVWEHPVFANIQEVAIFAWMISRAAWRPCTLRTRWGQVHLGTGQILVSERYIASGLNMQQRTVRKVFARMVADGMIQKIETQADPKAGTIWELLNYHQYQTSSDQTNQAEDHSVIATAIATAIGASSVSHRHVIKVQIIEESKKGKKGRKEDSLVAEPALPFASPILADERAGEQDIPAVGLHAGDAKPPIAVEPVSVPAAPPGPAPAPAMADPASGAPLTIDAAPPAQEPCPGPALADPPAPPKRIRQGTTRVKRPTEMDEAMAGEFETWFAAYGRLERKAEARAAYLKVRQQGVDPVILLNAARTQALHRQVQIRRQACVWLKARQWEDVIVADQPLRPPASNDRLSWLRELEDQEEAARVAQDGAAPTGPIIDGYVEAELETVH